MGTMERLSTLVAELIRDFHCGQIARMAGHYDFPLALHLEDRLVVLNVPAELENYLYDLMTAARAAGFCSTKATVSAIELPRKGRFRAWVHYDHLNAGSEVVGQSERTLFCRDLGERIVVEMVQLTRMPANMLRDWTPEQRLIA